MINFVNNYANLNALSKFRQIINPLLCFMKTSANTNNTIMECVRVGM